MNYLKEKTAIITGGGKADLKDGSPGSIGYGVALAQAKEGANLVLTGRNTKKLEDAKVELEQSYDIKVLTLETDISAGADNEQIIKNVVEKTINEFSRIDVLINVAQATASGISLVDQTTELKRDQGYSN